MLLNITTKLTKNCGTLMVFICDERLRTGLECDCKECLSNCVCEFIYFVYIRIIFRCLDSLWKKF